MVGKFMGFAEPLIHLKLEWFPYFALGIFVVYGFALMLWNKMRKKCP